MGLVNAYDASRLGGEVVERQQASRSLPGRPRPWDFGQRRLRRKREGALRHFLRDEPVQFCAGASWAFETLGPCSSTLPACEKQRCSRRLDRLGGALKQRQARRSGAGGPTGSAMPLGSSRTSSQDCSLSRSCRRWPTETFVPCPGRRTVAGCTASLPPRRGSDAVHGLAAALRRLVARGQRSASTPHDLQPVIVAGRKAPSGAPQEPANLRTRRWWWRSIADLAKGHPPLERRDTRQVCRLGFAVCRAHGVAPQAGRSGLDEARNRSAHCGHPCGGRRQST